MNKIGTFVGGVNAESTSAVDFSGGAVLPADGTVTFIASLARRVAEETTHLLVRLASQRVACTTAVGVLSAGDANIGLARGAIW